ncbi:MAG: hypothetical protein P8M67_04785 [Opitutales bacterium]|nr:hypothetical protein [Opitutales bacterium]
MVKRYKTLVIEPKGLRVKGDDTSLQIAEILEKESNTMLDSGWEVHSVFPSLASDGATLKLVVLFSQPN